MQLARSGRLFELGLCYVACLALAALVAGSGGMNAMRAALVAVFLLPKELANTLLLLHPFGRRVLRRREIAFAVATSVLLLAAGLLGAARWLLAAPLPTELVGACAVGGLLAAVLHFALEHSRIRRTTWVLIALMALLIVIAAIVLAHR